ncbi:hypothetical protein RJ640_008395 [Escallonia rubra]|uniref:Exocyst subunit Exo70 family protein n=1 Tax=Escallonia rubra TaxID=112253 RepID=A0AA88RI40_9ASTE|nr:hypothetical protein RJ640_008395 [Escallonia rubra]
MEGSDNVEVAFQSALNTILHWDSTVAAGEGINKYLLAVDDVRCWMESTVGEAASEDRSKADYAMTRAMARLKHEFENILTRDTAPRYSTCSSSLTDSSSYDMDYDLPSPETISDLRSIAVRMNSGGYLGECVKVYSSARKALVDLHFDGLGVERLSTGDVRMMEWQLLDFKINKWKRAVKVCMRIIFTNEWRLCKQVFEGLGRPGTDGACFRMVAKDAATHLFNFADAITNIRPSPEKLFRILDIHEALSDPLPDSDVPFPSIRIQGAEVLIPRLSKVVREVLQKFEEALLGELSQDLPPGGGIHTLTIYVMKYVVRISNYEQTLTRLITIKPEVLTAELIELEERTPLELHLIWILEKLRFKLEVKSKHYKNALLADLFMMNNIQYMVGEILTCPKLRSMITDDFLTRLKRTVQQAATSYQRATLVKVLSCLRPEGLNVNGVSKSALRKRIKTFNLMFEEVHKTQVRWSVPDSQLREELRLSITQKVILAYRFFTEQHLNAFGRTLYLKYTPEDLETACLELFEGDVPRPEPPCEVPRPKPCEVPPTYHYHRARKGYRPYPCFKSASNWGNLEEFSLEMLLLVTYNFSEEHIIGIGSYGPVYRATLNDDRAVAIRRAKFSTSSTDAGGTMGREDKDNAFLKELELLSRLNHRNLARLLGFCKDSNELVLVSEYMSNGNLYDHLHKLKSPRLRLWPARIKVALDVARGIEYLHTRMVSHGDINSSNVWLDATWTARVSDVGLLHETSPLSFDAAGSTGYMDPERYRLQRLTTKSDVYSFGVLLLELLSGNMVACEDGNGVPRRVVDFVVPYIEQDNLCKVLDPEVSPSTPFEIEAVEYMGYLAADCTSLEVEDRPTMTEIVSSLERALAACVEAPASISSSA